MLLFSWVGGLGLPVPSGILGSALCYYFVVLVGWIRMVGETVGVRGFPAARHWMSCSLSCAVFAFGLCVAVCLVCVLLCG